MFYSEKFKSKPLAILLTLIFIGFISLLDYITGEELSFSVFYVIPIAFLALNKTSSKSQIITISFIAATCWYIIDVQSKSYSHPFYPFWNAHVRLVIFISIGLLVYSFRKKHDELNETNIKLKYINDEKNKFIGIAAHDIRNPVSGIYSFSELLLDDDNSKMNSEELEIVKIIKSLSLEILELTSNLLDVSKIESGKIDLNYIHQDYIFFIKRKMKINQLLANPKNIVIQLESEHEILMSEFDDNYMSEVINNLLSNAIKFSEKNCVIIIRISENNDLVLTEVIDRGKGIPLEEQDKLFNYFQKSSTKPTDGESSTGLGLAIVKNIVTNFQGSIGIKSTLNEGSNFYFTFPVKR
jgi:signal transduction histidine kinase